MAGLRRSGIVESGGDWLGYMATLAALVLLRGNFVTGYIDMGHVRRMAGHTPLWGKYEAGTLVLGRNIQMAGLTH
ncbi:MAG: hypothetical protein JWR51_4700 [Devosia sp.]|nr:hypothetical protein [Devosia sp.]